MKPLLHDSERLVDSFISWSLPFPACSLGPSEVDPGNGTKS